MSGLHRVFVAVPLQDHLRDAVVEVQHRLQDAGAVARWTRPAHLHFTLRFLGEIPLAQVARVKLAAREAAGGVAPFAISLRSLGAFPSFQRPQVVWISVEEGREALQGLAQRLDGLLAAHRFAPEQRPFRPHLTLGRVRDTREWGDLVRALGEFKDVAVGNQTVELLVVMESRLTPKGPVYTPLEEVRLSAYEK